MVKVKKKFFFTSTHHLLIVLTPVHWFTEKHELEDHDSFGLEFEGLLMILLLKVLIE